ncbi:hypothetical protein ACFOGJ_08580 [Marinibaculum pumilum]|uniref:Class I SAM-dependent methyltransferase n=1 Tax=Marinibaculum pumilum TaxID=1766165 RepID=A0ABV7KY06_9PROT
MKWVLYRFLNRHVLPHHGLILRKYATDGDDAADSPELLARQDAALAGLLSHWAAAAGFAGAPDEAGMAAWVAEFREVHARRPIRDNKGGAGFNSSLCLWLTARLAQPRAVIESGTFQGHSAWLLRQALPDAEIVTYDTVPENLQLRLPDIDYRHGDWSADDAAPPSAAPADTLLFFDDHVSHARRLREAVARGYPLALLDDDVPADALYATGWPPAPSLSMLFDPDLVPGQEVAWRRNGRRKQLILSAEDLAVRDLVAAHRHLPDLAPVNRYGSNRGMALVRLRPPAS